MKKIDFVKLGTLLVLSFVVFTVAFSLLKAKEVEEKQNAFKAEVESVKRIVDYRYTSFDNKFFITNNIVLDEDGKEIGTLYIKTNDSLLEVFYNKEGHRKTQFYYNIKNGDVKIKEK